MSQVDFPKIKTWLRTSVWVFPAALLIILLLFTTLRISGTSVGTYHDILYGTQTKDPDLIFNHPRAIRSDEWLGGTQLLISQSKNGFPKFNHALPGGQDQSLQTDMPTKDWPTFFRPHLWAFFVLPLENAFAFKWWIVMYLLMVGCYFFILRVYNNRLFSALISFAVGISPFELWWYQSDGFLALAYGFFMLILFMRMMNRETIPFIKSQRLTNASYVLTLAFLMTAFGLLFYPPFQIPVAVVMLFFAIGYIAHVKFEAGLAWRTIVKRLGLVLISIIVTALLGLIFLLQHKPLIDSIGNSVYPGHRITKSGGMPMLQMFDAFVMPVEQSDLRGNHFFENQSEASNFILLLPFLLLPGFILIIRDWLKQRKIDWVFLALQLCGVLLIIRAFTPIGGPFFKLLLLNRVPNNGRLIIGFGFLGVLQLAYLVKKIADAKIEKKRLGTFALLYGAVCFLFLLLVSSAIRTKYPLFLHNPVILLGLAGAFTCIIVAVLANLRSWAAALFLLFTLASTFNILPLYRGLGILTHGSVVKEMSAVASPKSTWVTVGNDALLYESFGILTGGGSISGETPPNPKFWSQVAGPAYAHIYNREAHVFYVDSNQDQPIFLNQNNMFTIGFRCDSNFIHDHAQFALSVHPLSYPCLQQKSTVGYPNVTFYLYKIMPNRQ